MALIAAFIFVIEKGLQSRNDLLRYDSLARSIIQFNSTLFDVNKVKLEEDMTHVLVSNKLVSKNYQSFSIPL